MTMMDVASKVANSSKIPVSTGKLTSAISRYLIHMTEVRPIRRRNDRFPPPPVRGVSRVCVLEISQWTRLALYERAYHAERGKGNCEGRACSFHIGVIFILFF